MKKFLKLLLIIGALVISFVAGRMLTLMEVKEELDNEDNISTSGSVISNYGNTTISAGNNSISNVDFVYATNYRSVTIRFIPKKNIESLKLKVQMSDSTNFLLDSQIISVGDVIEGQQYTITVTLSNNDITAGKVISTTELNVYGGTIKS